MSCRLERATLSHVAGNRALDQLSLTVEPGERVAIIGPSGAGKTTLLRVLSTELKPSVGEVSVLGAVPWSLSRRELQRLRARVGMIHQSPPLPPRQRVITTVAAGRLGQWSLARAMVNLAWPLDRTGVGDALARLDMADSLYSRCDTLSGGQWQRVAVARVLYQEPDLVLADEPVSAMDPRLAAHLIDVLAADSARRGSTLVASLHAVDLALEHFPRIIGLCGGRVVFDGPPSTVSARDLEALYANQKLRPLPGHPEPVPAPAPYPCR